MQELFLQLIVIFVVTLIICFFAVIWPFDGGFRE